MTQKESIPRVLVIGAGASGLLAAIAAARSGVRVDVLETHAQPGKKLLMTGNGRCNFSNRVISANCYHSEDPAFPMQVIDRFDGERTLAFFREIGLYTRERDGWLYPRSNEARAVRDALVYEAERLGVRMHLHTSAASVTKSEDGYSTVTGEGYTYRTDAVILACGSRAGLREQTNGDVRMNGYELAAGFGHRILPLLPSLVPLRMQSSFLQKLAGLRTDARIRLICGAGPDLGKVLQEEEGELQITERTISGIPVMQLSGRFMQEQQAGRAAYLEIDFFPDLTVEELMALTKERAAGFKQSPVSRFFTGFIPEKLGSALLLAHGISQEQPADKVTDRDWLAFYRFAKQVPLSVSGPRSMSEAQVCMGGVDTSQIDPATMASKLSEGLFFAGEMVDADGRCGGYNLQFAWSSGHIAGESAAAYALHSYEKIKAAYVGSKSIL